MLSQRVRIRCEPDKKQVSKWTAEGAVKRVISGPLSRDMSDPPEYSATLGCALIIRDMIVSCKAHGCAVNQGGPADKFIRP